MARGGGNSQCAHPASNAATSLGRHCNATHASQPSSHGSVHPRCVGDQHASVRASGIERERSCPTAWATPLVLADRDRSFQNWSVHQHGSAMGRSSWTSVGFNGSTRSCTHSRQEIRRIKSGISITLQQQKIFKRVTVEPASIGCAVSELRKKWKKTRSVEIRKKQSTGGRLPLNPRRFRDKLAKLAQRAEVWLGRQLQIRRLTNV